MTAGPALDPDDLSALFAAAPAALLVLRPDAPAFTIAAATDAYLRATLQTRDSLVGRPVFDALPDANPGNPAPTGVTNLRASLETVLRTGAPHAMPVQRYDLRRPDGTWEERHWAPRNAPVVGPDGAVRYLVHSVEDVTARVRAEHERAQLLAEVAAERDRLEYVFRRSPYFLSVVRGPDHVMTLQNDAYYAMVGHRDLTGRPLAEAIPELEAQGFIALLDRVLATGEPFVGRELPAVLARTPGAPPEERFVDFSYLPLVEADGRRTGVIAHGADVTDHVHARREVERLLAESERARAEAQAASRAKSDFLAVMSHELRTPLNAIAGYAQLMELGLHGPVTPEQVAALDRIQRGQQHLLGLINAVLNYARLEAGHVEYAQADVPVGPALAEVAALIAPQAHTKGLTLSVAPCGPDPDGAPLVARADPEKVRQVLLNLLSNAVKFTRGGGTVTLGGGRTPDGRLALRVADTGRGIPADQLERVFQPFVQVDAPLTRTQEGTGLGLAISRDLARGMGGDLTAESTVGVGSTFTLTLPVATPDPA